MAWVARTATVASPLRRFPHSLRQDRSQVGFRPRQCGDSVKVMRGRMVRSGISKRLWRPLLGAVVAYAVAAQSLLIVFGGFALAARADAGAPGFELCLHDGQSAPNSSGGAPSHPGCTHCIFCFAGSHHAVAAAPPAFSHRVDVEFVAAPWTSDQRALPRFYAYSIANPRGPPLPA